MVAAKKKSTLENILTQAHDLFLTRGFSATSVDEICKKAKVTKGGFFHYFKSKECLAKQVLQRFCSHSREGIYKVGCCEETADPLDRVFALLDGLPSVVSQSNKHHGCLIATFIQELSQSHPEIQSICVQGLKEWAALFNVQLSLAKEKYSPESDINIKSLANYCITVVQGAQLMAKANSRQSVFSESIAHLKEYLMYVFKINHQKGGRYE